LDQAQIVKMHTRIEEMSLVVVVFFVIRMVEGLRDIYFKFIGACSALHAEKMVPYMGLNMTLREFFFLIL